MNKLALSRRMMLRGAFGTAAAAFLKPWAGTAIAQTQPFLNDPFTLGIASGDPTPDGFVLWTRLAPQPFENLGGLHPEPIGVTVVVAEDESFRRIVRQSQVLARPDRGFSVHAEIRDLPPGRPFFYRFQSNGVQSPVGRTKTAPAYGAPLEHFRMAWATCQHYEQGFFTPYRDMVEQDPDLILHMGDYIYESSWGPQIRRHVVPEPVALEEYRATHAIYKMERELQAAHAAAPWLFIWDDHEVDNDYAGDISEEPDVSIDAFRARRIAAYRAFFEHMPLRRRSILTAEGSMRIWGKAAFGDLMEVNLCDGRQYRTPMACPTEDDRGGNVIARDCAERLDENRSYLGVAQERWLNRNFARGPARWNVIAQPTLFSQFYTHNEEGMATSWSDGWDGYPAARQRMVDLFASRPEANPVVLGGDTHCYWVADVKQDFNDPESAVVASEFVTTSISSHHSNHDGFAQNVPNHPHIRHFDARERGYGLIDFRHDRMDVALRVVETTFRRDGAAARDQARFVVEAGQPGPIRL